MRVTLSPVPDLLPLYRPPMESLLVITDVFRASATILSALYHGACSVRPVATEEEAKRYWGYEGCIVAAERDALRCDFAQLGNDPEEYMPEVVRGKDIVLTTTNGTRAIDWALRLGYRHLTVGSFGNLSALVRHISERHYPEVMVVAAGWKGTVCAEDTLFAAALYERIAERYASDPRKCTSSFGQCESVECNDALLFPLESYRLHRADLCSFVRNFEHYKRLERLDRLRAIPICLEEDRYPVLPCWMADGTLRTKGSYL